MRLTALDPVLVVYDERAWRANPASVFPTLETLMLHRDCVRVWASNWTFSDALLGYVMQRFPWQSYRQVPEFRDWFILLTDDIARALKLNEGEEAQWRPDGETCHGLPEDCRALWSRFLGALAAEAIQESIQPTIATDSATDSILRVSTRRGTTEIPLMWDEESWYAYVGTVDWWPDLERAVQACFVSNPAFRSYANARLEPRKFSVSHQFRTSLEGLDADLRTRAIVSMTKRTFDILDAGLGDEAFGNVRRCRVTDFWRIHYSMRGEAVLFEAFGPHNLGGVD